MPPRLRCPAARGLGSALQPSTVPSQSALLLRASTSLPTSTPEPRRYASALAEARLRLPEGYVPPVQPPSARRPETRKAQLLRTYTSLLRTSPLMLVFQHNNLTAVEWAAIRRELRLALAAVPVPEGTPDFVAKAQLQIIRTTIFDVALKLVEFYDPSTVKPTTATALDGKKVKVQYNHDLSKAAYKTVKAIDKGETPLPEDSTYAQISPLLVGPVAVLNLPAVSPAHLAAALSVLAPNPPAYPAPSRKKNPGYWDPVAQAGLQKLLLVGGRVEGKVFDQAGVEWVGSIEGGLDGMRAQLVHMLQTAGLGLTSTLEGAGNALWLTMESRRSVMEEEANPKKEEEKAEGS